MLDLLPPDQRKGFLRLFGQFVQQRQKPALEWARLEPPPREAMVQATDIPPCPKDQALRHELLDKMVILKLNGERVGCKMMRVSTHTQRAPAIYTRRTAKLGKT